MRILLSLFFLALFTAGAHADIYVLCYHSFLGKKHVTYDFSNDELRSHLRFLSDRGFRFISLRDIQEGRVGSGKNVLVTIDDGNHSVYRAFYDVFRPLGIKPLLSIYPNIIGKKEYALNWQQLKQLAGDGCDIASHGYFHLKLNNKLFTENKRNFMQEIVKSKQMLEEKLGISITSFVYPFGLNTDVAEEALRNSGYRLAFTIVNNPVKYPLERNLNVMRLPRYMLTRSHFQGSLNHIAAIAEKGSKVSLASNGVSKKSEKVPEEVHGTRKMETARHEPARQAAAVRKNTGKRAKDDIRYGVAYDNARGPEKVQAQNGKKKRKKSPARKKEITTAPAQTPERTIAAMQEPAKSAPADQVFLYNRSAGAGTAGMALPAGREMPLQAPDHRVLSTPAPGGLKQTWNVIARDIVEFYNRLIHAQLEKASRYLQRAVSFLTR
jgi:peptidoglycan/xylan/chitin deacetylase (PgdA/CDA1 family)